MDQTCHGAAIATRGERSFRAARLISGFSRRAERSRGLSCCAALILGACLEFVRVSLCSKTNSLRRALRAARLEEEFAAHPEAVSEITVLRFKACALPSLLALTA